MAKEIWMGWLKRESGNAKYACMGDHGRAFGLYQFDYRFALYPFLAFCVERDPVKYADFARYANEAPGSGLAVGNKEFHAIWTAHANDKGFRDLQDEYALSQYYEPAKRYLWNLYHINADDHSAALRGSLYSFSIRSGQLVGARKFSGGGKTEEELLRNAYSKYTDSEDDGRWPRQLADALAYLETEAPAGKRNAYVAAFESFYGLNEGDGSHKVIIDLYNTFLPHPRGYTAQYTDAWCAEAASAAAIKAGVAKIFPIECGCEEMIEKAKAAGIWIEDDAHVPIRGELVLYDWDDSGVGDCTGRADHVGAVVEIDGRTIKVIEGNKNNMVGYRRIDVNSRQIRGYISPRYEELDTMGNKENKKEYPALVPGSQGDRVKWWQDGLLALGFADCSFYFAESDFANGYYGDHTKNFTSRFQHYFGLTVDGCAGEESQKKMEEELAKWNFDKLNFTVDQLMDRAEKVWKKYKAKGYKWGSADIAPWYQPEILKSSCDRGQDEIFHTLLELGNREAKEISRRLLELGGEKITDVRDVQAGDVVFLDSWHVFLAASGRDANGNYKRYDFGNDDRFAADQPFTEPIKNFKHAVRVCKKAADPEPKKVEARKYTIKIEQIGLGSDGPSVGIAQAILKSQDYYVGKIDNDFGVKTDTAVREWQADKIVEGKPVGGADGKPDGIVGRDSWSELLGIDVKA